MTDAILGHDVDGRELRAGDRVELVDHPCLEEDARRHIGLQGTIVGSWPSPFSVPCVDTDIPDPDCEVDTLMAPCPCVRLINSGRDLFDRCAREADKMPTESTIRQRMPWTEPEEL